MTEIRCVKCRRLLMKAEGLLGRAEIKCPKCGYYNSINMNDSKHYTDYEKYINRTNKILEDIPMIQA